MNKKVFIDITMLIILPLLMAYSLIGESLHEILGITIFILFILHHLLNIKSLKTIFKGKYNLHRLINTTINLSLMIFMFAQPISGILMSKHLFSFMNIKGFSASAREIHMFFAYWGFVLMSLHAGMHLRYMINIINKKMNSKIIQIIRLFIHIVSVYGIYAFFKRHIHEYLFRITNFAFFDYNEALFIFFFDYLCIMSLFMCIGYYINLIGSKNYEKRN